jgi:hypothetical protein
VPSDSGPEHVPYDPPFSVLQFTSDEDESVLQELDVNKGSGSDGIPPIILKNCASVFAKPLSLLFNRSMARWKVSYVTSIFKRVRRNNVEDYRGVAILSAIPKLLELLVYKEMHKDLKNIMCINQHGFMKNRSTIMNLLEYASFVLNSIEAGNQVDSIYKDFSKAFDRVRRQLLLNEMSVVIELTRCMWLGSYLSGRIKKIIIGDAVSKDIKVTSGARSGELHKRSRSHHGRGNYFFGAFGRQTSWLQRSLRY